MKKRTHQNAEPLRKSIRLGTKELLSSITIGKWKSARSLFSAAHIDLNIWPKKMWWKERLSLVDFGQQLTYLQIESLKWLDRIKYFENSMETQRCEIPIMNINRFKYAHNWMILLDSSVDSFGKFVKSTLDLKASS